MPEMIDVFKGLPASIDRDSHQHAARTIGHVTTHMGSGSTIKVKMIFPFLVNFHLRYGAYFIIPGSLETSRPQQTSA